MKFFNIVSRKTKKPHAISDYYQESLNRVGKEQFKKLVDKGLRVPIVTL